jgi:hypothetical protein
LGAQDTAAKQQRTHPEEGAAVVDHLKTFGRQGRPELKHEMRVEVKAFYGK